MRKIFIVLVFIFGCSSTPVPEPSLDWQHYFGSEPAQLTDDPIVNDAIQRSAVIITAGGACTGGIGNTGIILTASHCLSKDEDIFVNGYKAKVVKNIPEKDLLFLHIYTGEFKPLDIVEPKVDMEVFVVMVQNQLRGVVKRGRITHVQEETFSMDIILIPGASGSFVYTKDGKLVGIVQAWGLLMSHGVSGQVIHKVFTG